MQKYKHIKMLKIISLFMIFALHLTMFDNANFFQKNDLSFIFRTPAWAGTWIFFILSGFLAGKSFFNMRYDLTVKGFLKYYWKRLQKVIIPTLIFVFILFIFSNDMNRNYYLLLNLVFWYKGTPEIFGSGVVWYVSTLFWLYLLSPFFALLLKKICTSINSNKKLIFIFGGLYLIGATWRLITTILGLNWNNYCYTPFYANLDLFFCGFILPYIIEIDFFKKMRCYSFLKKISIILFILIIVVNCFIYNLSFFDVKYMIQIYKIILPSIYILLISSILIVFEDAKENNNEFSIVDKIDSISFEFFLCHCLVIYLFTPKLMEFLNVSENISIIEHYEIMVILFVIAVLFSVIIKYLYKGICILIEFIFNRFKKSNKTE